MRSHPRGLFVFGVAGLGAAAEAGVEVAERGGGALDDRAAVVSHLADLPAGHPARRNEVPPVVVPLVPVETAEEPEVDPPATLEERTRTILVGEVLQHVAHGLGELTRLPTPRTFRQCLQHLHEGRL